jgi:hypothetical protein
VAAKEKKAIIKEAEALFYEKENMREVCCQRRKCLFERILARFKANNRFSFIKPIYKNSFEHFTG